MQDEITVINYTYTADDFFNSTAPYEEIYKHKSNPFVHEKKLTQMCDYAKTVGIKNFKKLYSEYTKSLLIQNKSVYINNVTSFQNQEIELDAGDWECDDYGVKKPSSWGDEIACPHPIMPVERLVNIDTGEEKLRVAYSKGKKWRSIIVDKNTLASTQKITSLAIWGIAVNSSNAKSLIDYLSDIENINYDRIPEYSSVSRLGYIGDEGFSPYVDGLIFDGEANYKNIFSSVVSHGKRDKWIECAKECRQNTSAKIVLASSFASVLVQKIGSLPFFVHLWGVESGTGKTVALMLAASVWGNPASGQFVQTFNATEVGHERMAAFLNSLPMCIDELQLSRTAKGKPTFNIYNLAQGVGRTRGNKAGGVDKTPTWGNCILTTGESPLASLTDGAGALNRVIEIECKTDNKVIADGVHVSSIVKKNYGFAGKEFVEYLIEEGVQEKLEARYKKLFSELSNNDATEKQSMAAALIVMADEIISQVFFEDKPLTVKEISEFLKTNAAVSMGQRGYDFICGWVSQNINRFNTDTDNTGEIYGVIDNDYAYINAKKFRDVCENEGISSASLLSWLKQKKLIKSKEKRNTVMKKIRGIPTNCVALIMPDDEEEAEYREKL